MERLTNKNLTKACNDPWDYCGMDSVCTRDCHKPTPCKIPKIVHRLAEIEDILGEDYDLARLRELVEADQNGRCVVLPCKDWLEIVFGEQEIFYGIDRDYEENPIREITVWNEERFTWYDGWKTVVLKGHDENGLDWEFSPEDIGKTVFLTREAAEAALKGEQNG